MKLTGHTILITGGGTGIGRGLAVAFHKLGNRVIITGRRPRPLEETAAAYPGMSCYPLNVTDAAAVARFVPRLLEEHAGLNVLVNNASIMHAENLLADPIDVSRAEAVVATNLLAPIRLTSALLPQLRRQSAATILNVSSGLGFVPMALTPTYCATKAAMHSYTESLRFQLRASTVEVLELIPPYVATNLMNGADDPHAMPLESFLVEAIQLLAQHPTPLEITVERVKSLRHAAQSGLYEAIFQEMNAPSAELR